MCVVYVFYGHKYVLMYHIILLGFFGVCDVHILCVGKRVLMNLGVEGQRSASSVFLGHSPSCLFLKQGLSLILDHTNLARQAGQCALESAYLCPQLPAPLRQGFVVLNSP